MAKGVEEVALSKTPALYPWGQPISSWDEVRAEIEGKPLGKTGGDNGNQEGLTQQNQGLSEHQVEETSEIIEVEGDLPPLLQEGPRVMICIKCEVRQTRHGVKDYLYWCDEDSSFVLPQFFRHYKKYPLGSKAVRNCIAAMGVRPKRLDRISLRSLIGLRAEVFVETVRPSYNEGALKGKPMPENLHYSKVAEILRPLSRLDPNTQTQLRKKTR